MGADARAAGDGATPNAARIWSGNRAAAPPAARTRKAVTSAHSTSPCFTPPLWRTRRAGATPPPSAGRSRAETTSGALAGAASTAGAGAAYSGFGAAASAGAASTFAGFDLPAFARFAARFSLGASAFFGAAAGAAAFVASGFAPVPGVAA